MLIVTIVPFTANVMIDYEYLTAPILLYGANLLLLSFTAAVHGRRPRVHRGRMHGASPTRLPE